MLSDSMPLEPKQPRIYIYIYTSVHVVVWPPSSHEGETSSKGQGAFKEGQGHQDLEVPGNSRKDQGQPVGSLKGETRELEGDKIPSHLCHHAYFGELGSLASLADLIAWHMREA